MAFEQVIKGTLLPKVPLKTLFEEDTSSENSGAPIYRSPEYMPDSSQHIGANEPYIKIGGVPLTSIELMTIDESGFIPTLTLTFIDGQGKFAGEAFPKTDLLLSLYLKVGNEKLKPVRCDFLIKSVKTMAPKYSGEKEGLGIGVTYTIRGELYIPNIYKSISKSYSDSTSKEALTSVATELGLGFAENESKPTDKMTWINPNTSHLSFIQKVLNHSYQDDDSFFIGFIDKYYYLNYIEVNKQLKTGDFDSTYVNHANPMGLGIKQTEKDNPETNEINETFVENFLTTSIEARGDSNYIVEISILSDQGDILKNQGFSKKIYYYDHLKKIEDEPSEKIIDFFMEPLKSQDRGTADFLIPLDEDLAKTSITKWMNIDYGNTHTEFNAARLLNSHNINELGKIKLKVRINNINFQVIRGSMIPLYITTQYGDKLMKSVGDLEDTPETKASLLEEIPDEQLSGLYYVLGAKYYYDSLDKNGLYTELILARREWRPSAEQEEV